MRKASTKNSRLNWSSPTLTMRPLLQHQLLKKRKRDALVKKRSVWRCTVSALPIIKCVQSSAHAMGAQMITSTVIASRTRRRQSSLSQWALASKIKEKDVTARKVNAKKSIVNVLMLEYLAGRLANATIVLTAYAPIMRLSKKQDNQINHWKTMLFHL